MLFDPLILIQQPLAVLATLAIILFGKSLAAFFPVRLFGHSQRTALTIAASWRRLVSSRLSGGTGNGIEFTAAGRTKPVLAGAILSIMLNPVLFALLEKYLAKTETLEEQTLEEAIEEEKQIPVDICNHALLVGYGRVGSLLGRNCSPLIFRWW